MNRDELREAVREEFEKSSQFEIIDDNDVINPVLNEDILDAYVKKKEGGGGWALMVTGEEAECFLEKEGAAKALVEFVNGAFLAILETVIQEMCAKVKNEKYGWEEAVMSCGATLEYIAFEDGFGIACKERRCWEEKSEKEAMALAGAFFFKEYIFNYIGRRNKESSTEAENDMNCRMREMIREKAMEKISGGGLEERGKSGEKEAFENIRKKFERFEKDLPFFTEEKKYIEIDGGRASWNMGIDLLGQYFNWLGREDYFAGVKEIEKAFGFTEGTLDGAITFETEVFETMKKEIGEWRKKEIN